MGSFRRASLRLRLHRRLPRCLRPLRRATPLRKIEQRLSILRPNGGPAEPELLEGGAVAARSLHECGCARWSEQRAVIEPQLAQR